MDRMSIKKIRGEDQGQTIVIKYFLFPCFIRSFSDFSERLIFTKHFLNLNDRLIGLLRKCPAISFTIQPPNPLAIPKPVLHFVRCRV